MKLTKQMLRVALFVLLIPFTSMAANDVTTYPGITFETNSLGPIHGIGGWVTGDVAVAEVVYTNRTYAGEEPITGATATGTETNNMLYYEAGSGILTNEFTSGQINNYVYIDTLIRMNNTDEIPASFTNDSLAKMAVYLDAASSNLVLLHSATSGGGDPTTTNKITTLTNTLVNGEEWIRLTISFDFVNGQESPPQPSILAQKANYFQIRVNGNVVSNYSGYLSVPMAVFSGFTYDIPASTESGSWFMCANNTSNKASRTVESVGFSGAGFLDNFDATIENPFAPPTVFYTVSVSNVIGGTISPTAEQTNIPFQGDGTNLTFTADAGYYLAYIKRGALQLPPAPNYLPTNIISNVTISASFQLNNTTLSNGVPQEWMQQVYGIWTNDYAGAASDDPDQDGFSTADEWLFSTDPTNGNSTPMIAEISVTNSKPVIKWISNYITNSPAMILPPFNIEANADIANPASWSVITNITRQDGLYTNEIEVGTGSTNRYFYRVVATNAP